MKRNLIRAIFAIFGLGVLCLIYGFSIEPRRLEIREVQIQTDDKLNTPLKIVLVSDIHIGGLHVSPKRVSKIVKTINAQSPDIVLIAGDFVNGHERRENHSDAFNTKIDTGVANLSSLSSPLGVYAVLGNHDAWYDKNRLRAKLEAADVTVLVNEFTTPQKGVCLVGLADADTGREDPNIFKGCPATDRIIALMHSPDSFLYMPSETMIGFAGHTHGGQINLPIIGRAVTATRIGRRYAYGSQRFGGVPVYITAGIGTSILPARFRAPPEIVVLTLN